MHHSKVLVFTFIMMLIFSRCTVSINNYSTLYMVQSIPLAFFMPPKELWEAYSNRTVRPCVRPCVRPAFVSGPYLLYSLR